MREIRFQAWDGEFMYEVTWLDLKDGKVFLVEGYAVGGSTKGSLHEGEIKAIRQYTGLKDKSGKKIYEGDIVRTRNAYAPTEHLFEVFWREKFAGFYLKEWEAKDKQREWIDLMYDGNLIDFEVVGNIYEHVDAPREQITYKPDMETK